jgi:hypothetical protein
MAMRQKEPVIPHPHTALWGPSSGECKVTLLSLSSSRQVSRLWIDNLISAQKSIMYEVCKLKILSLSKNPWLAKSVNLQSYLCPKKPWLEESVNWQSYLCPEVHHVGSLQIDNLISMLIMRSLKKCQFKCYALKPYKWAAWKVATLSPSLIRAACTLYSVQFPENFLV